jgi:hypothetical protein
MSSTANLTKSAPVADGTVRLRRRPTCTVASLMPPVLQSNDLAGTASATAGAADLEGGAVAVEMATIGRSTDDM